MMDQEELRLFLEAQYARFNRPDFIPDDPVSIPHGFTEREDIEIAGLLAAILAWGRRDLILRAARDLLARMDGAPHAFVTGASTQDLKGLRGFVYRTFQGEDAVALVRGLQYVYAERGGLEEVMALAPEDTDTLRGIMNLRQVLSAVPGFPQRTFKHLASPAAGSSAKRLNMYLRWMVRRDRRGVDFGLWTRLRPDQLICPLDVHTGTVARTLGLLYRRQDDWRAALELTAALRRLDPADPVRYDFALFGTGVTGDLRP